ncbi:diaminopimelate dehydrogenase [Virgibacillus sp. 179-BFC.A HS]|uniref:Meso-diaminopimelate D-dehydrogenase n=1 Tax=Tigheibacillus jepli TaxID=3035914 RepID=A0ABU5CH23_9BACI|nr:diaminopimelate dehydrogenase [Virgibacillus sp. 179-BFC.A HS]MDY0405134.1 diaminopimelate dehydrogenase [Virgibacillus sp. 179-BFC.A HS]
MANNIRVGIVGYGNLGRGVEIAISKNPDLTLAGIFTRRDPKSLTPASKTPVYAYDEMSNFKDDMDVMILCGGSATDLPVMSPEIAGSFNIVDSFDNHSKIPDHFAAVNKAAEESGKVAVISVGWDPGLFSLNRLLGEIVLPQGDTFTFWGEGLSQGHSDAVRRIEGVKKAVQYTVPIEEVLQEAREGKGADLTSAQRHKRVCYVVADEKDQARIEQEIKTMPDYFAPYDTTVNFISEEEFNKNHTKMKHGGVVIRSGKTSEEHKETVEFSLNLDSNPEFTASVLVAYARAAFRLNQEGGKGAKTAFDIPFAYLTPKSHAQILKDLL